MKKGIELKSYADKIKLYEPFNKVKIITGGKEEYVDFLLDELNEPETIKLSYAHKRRLLHGRINTLKPHTLSAEGISNLNCLLQLELHEKQVVEVNDLLRESVLTWAETKIVLWQGDISSLRIDAIVNAANNQLLGCWQPLHMCIDNVIHSAAGVQLRDDCACVMQQQGYAEPTGIAKLTRAYNLPSSFVMHTVGPIVQGQVTEQHERLLASVYQHCLDLGAQVEAISSIAFCGVSTGVFGYPAEKAAKVAIATVKKWLRDNPGTIETVVFNVFSDQDKLIYQDLLQSNVE